MAEIRASINADLKIIEDYLGSTRRRTGEDITEEARWQKEQRDRIRALKYQGLSLEEANGESLHGVNDILKLLSERKRDAAGEEAWRSPREQQALDLMAKFNIKVSLEEQLGFL